LYRFKFLALFCELGLKMLGPQQWHLLHVEKDDQVIRHLGDERENHLESIFVQKISQK
jgi:hypothetical protein